MRWILWRGCLRNRDMRLLAMVTGLLLVVGYLLLRYQFFLFPVLGSLILGLMVVILLLSGSCWILYARSEACRHMNIRLVAKREADALATILALVNVIDLKDSYTGGHSKQVMLWSQRIAQKLNLSPEQIKEIVIAASLHDLGKIGIPEMILNKPDRLSEEEFRIIKTHPPLGAIIVRSISTLDHSVSLENISRIILYHHEWYNGQGYPEGLEGENIPLGSRVIAAADAFDAMTTHRVYRRALSVAEATAILIQEKGRQFDPVVIDALLACISEHLKTQKKNADGELAQHA